MCTVTYLPLANGDFIFTSNRDETPLRKTSAPEIYTESGVKLLYPKDVDAGGTWIGLSSHKRLVCLLNGGFEKHKRKLPYRMSRGEVVKKSLKAVNLLDFIDAFDFENIEPFTLIGIDWKDTEQAIELVWNGNQKYIREIDQQPSIWSSSTLYDAHQKELRNRWFAEWLGASNPLSKEEILKFHQNENLGDRGVSVKMNRLFVQTVSTSRIVKQGSELTFDYFDYLNNSISTKQMKLA